MRLIIAVLLLLATPIVYSQSEEQAYIVVRATLADENKRQPMWLCMAGPFDCEHISVSELIVGLAPGSYKMDHVDFVRHEGSLGWNGGSNGSHFFKTPVTYKLEAGNIYFIGHFIFSEANKRSYNVELNYDSQLVLDACKAAPKIFESYPLASFNSAKKTKVFCERKTQTNEQTSSKQPS